MPPPLEIPVFSPSSAAAAIRLGASRIEYNASGSYPEGGLTPQAPGDLAAFTLASVPIRVMIRPRGPPHGSGPDFLYSDDEFKQMSEELRRFTESGHMNVERGDGFVFGMLKPTESGSVIVDVERNKVLVEQARPYRCVFHRAFDDVIGSSAKSAVEDSLGREKPWEQALEDVTACGFDGILTSGGPGKAPDHIGTLQEIVGASRGRIEIIVGGGVRSQNVQGLGQSIGNDQEVWYHSSCLTGTSAAEVDEDEVQKILEQLGHV